VGGFDLKLSRTPSADEVWSAAQAAGLSGRSEVVFTGYGEPTLRLEVLLDLNPRRRGAGVRRVRLDTDGLANLRQGRDVAPALAAAGLGAVSVSLNAPDAATYARLCPNRYGERAWHAARGFIRCCLAVLPEVTASCVALPELSEAACRAEVEGLGARFRWRPYEVLGRVTEPPEQDAHRPA
jgi:TatD DNase family protein